MTLTDHIAQNGTRGRAAPALPEHTFADSGITIRVRKISPATQQRLAMLVQKDYPKPDPPTVKTELGDEPNPADPAYQETLTRWQQQQGLALNDKLMTFAALEAEVAIGPEERAQIARVRRNLELIGAWQDREGMTPEENEKILYVLHIACASGDDLREFGKVLTERSAPTEEAVRRHVETFPGDL